MTSIAQGRAGGIDSTYAWTRLADSVLLATIGGAGMWAVVVVLPAVQAEFGVDRAAASIPYTATMVGFAAGNVLVGRAIDRVGYWIPALISSLVLCAGFLLASLSTSILTFALAQGVFIGVGTSVIFGPLIADISHWFNRRRGVAVTAAASGNYLAGALWPTLMSYTMESHSWRFTYALMAGLAYDVSKSMKVDLGYRYRHIDGGSMFQFDPATMAAGASGTQGSDPGFDTHEVRLGLRYSLW